MAGKEMILNIKLPRIPIDGVIVDPLSTTTTEGAVGEFSAS